MTSLVRADAAPGQPDQGHEARQRGWFLQGFVNNVLNPKGTLFYLGIFTMVITPDTGVAVTALLILLMMAISVSHVTFPNTGIMIHAHVRVVQETISIILRRSNVKNVKRRCLERAGKKAIFVPIVATVILINSQL